MSDTSAQIEKLRRFGVNEFHYHEVENEDGYNSALDDVLALLEGTEEEPTREEAASWMKAACKRLEVMGYVVVSRHEWDVQTPRPISGEGGSERERIAALILDALATGPLDRPLCKVTADRILALREQQVPEHIADEGDDVSPRSLRLNLLVAELEAFRDGGSVWLCGGDSHDSSWVDAIYPSRESAERWLVEERERQIAERLENHRWHVEEYWAADGEHIADMKKHSPEHDWDEYFAAKRADPPLGMTEIEYGKFERDDGMYGWHIRELPVQP